MKLRVLDEAEQEVAAAAVWYEQKQPALGHDFLDEFSAACAALTTTASRYPRLETLRSRNNIRRLLLRRFPYMIVFECQGDEVVVLAVAHVSQKPNYWKKRI